MMSLYSGISLIYCVGCRQCVCNSTCMASHRYSYNCHNPMCHFHAPSSAPPAPLEQAPPQTVAPPTSNAPDAQATTATAIPNTDNTEGEWVWANCFVDPNVTCRETIFREWRQAGPDPNTTSEPAPSAPPRPASPDNTTVPHADVELVSAPPARFSIEEYQAQAQLLAHYQPRQNRQTQLAQGGGRTLGNSSSGQGSNRRPGVRILFE